MANATTEKPKAVENITVLQVGKYGVRVDEKTWFGVNEPLTPSHFVPSQGYKVAVVVSKTGKKYISEILGTEVVAEEAAPAPAPMTKAAPAAEKSTVIEKNSTKPMRAGYGQPLTEYDLAVQRQISRAGVYQAALSSPALAQWAVNVEEYLSLVRKVAEAGVKFVGE